MDKSVLVGDLCNVVSERVVPSSNNTRSDLYYWLHEFTLTSLSTSELPENYSTYFKPGKRIKKC